MNSYDESGTEAFVCPDCDGKIAKTDYVKDRFDYGVGTSHVVLSVTVPVEVCQECGAHHNTDRGDQIRHDAICQHLGLLPPAEVKRIRIRATMSRERFAEVSGIGSASLARWESGQLIQSKSQDNLLRLLESSTNLQFLQERLIGQNEPIAAYEDRQLNIRMKSLGGSKLTSAINASEKFQLRKAN